MYLSICLLNLLLVLLLWLNPDYPTNRRKKFLRKYFKKVIQRESFLRSIILDHFLPETFVLVYFSCSVTDS